jgi:hypothetical protein
VTHDEQKGFSEQEVQERFESIGRTLVEQGLYAEAIEANKELIRDYPASRWSANAYMAIAHCYHAMGQEEEELEALEDIITQFPDHVVAKRARGAIGALRERRHGEGGTSADLHGAVRRLTRQVERMHQAQHRRAWLGAITYLALGGVVLWLALRAPGGVLPAGLRDLDKRVTALESAVAALSDGGTSAHSPRPPAAPAPSVTVTPVTPAPVAPAAPAPQPAPKPSPAVKPSPKPAPAKPSAPPAAAARTYTVKQGDSLWTIASRELGDGRKAEEIARVNGLQAPYSIRVGDKLKLPAKR